MKIDSLTFQQPYILAPLAGYTDLPFRLLCREMGASFCVSEMISCHGLVYRQKKTLEMLATVPEERPVSFQIFGNDPAIMADAAALICEQPFDLLDINMGCPVKKVIKKGSGAALMKDFARAADIISGVCRNSRLPVSVKFRSGWNSESIVAADFAQMAEDSGAAMLTIHARTWAQGFGGLADQQVIAMVKDKVSIPVIGNGDILTYEDGQQMMANTGCDGVMIGRGALGNPWVFQPEGRPATFSQRQPVVLRHMELIDRFTPQSHKIFRMKNHASRYLSGFPGASDLRRRIALAKSTEDILRILQTD